MLTFAGKQAKPGKQVDMKALNGLEGNHCLSQQTKPLYTPCNFGFGTAANADEQKSYDEGNHNMEVLRVKLRKTISKMLALGTGAVMVGATILSATAAANLNEYPSPFVKDGKFNAILVVGDNAASSDVIGSVDIATSVQQENIRNVTTFISDEELPSLLADGIFSNTQGDYDYRQYIYFDGNPPKGDPGPMLSVVYAEDPDTSKAADYVYIDGSSGNVIARYALEFTESAKSDITDSAGAIATAGTYLWNFEGKNIKMLGKDWSIVKARTDSATTHNETDFTLMGGACCCDCTC